MKAPAQKVFLFAAGGTGGHIIPACRIAKHLQKKYKARIVFLGSNRGLESTIVPKWGFEILTVNVKPLPRRIGFSMITFPFYLLGTVIQAMWMIMKLKPVGILSTGGYASGPATIAARIMRIPLFLHEPNSFPGITLIHASKWARKVFYAFPRSKKYFKSNKNAVLVGNPMEMNEEIGLSREQYLSELQLDYSRKTVFVTGGSQGSMAINKVVESLLLGNRDFNLIWQTGSANYKEIIDSLEDKSPVNAVIKPFINDMTGIFSISDVVVSRAGAMTLTEIAAFKKPSILIPLPTAAEDHQTKNAESFVESGSAILVRQEDLTSGILMNHIESILHDEDLYMKMSEAAGKFYKADVLDEIANIIIESIGEHK